jgi:hypothetical protein
MSTKFLPGLCQSRADFVEHVWEVLKGTGAQYQAVLKHALETYHWRSVHRTCEAWRKNHPREDAFDLPPPEPGHPLQGAVE